MEELKEKMEKFVDKYDLTEEKFVDSEMPEEHKNLKLFALKWAEFVLRVHTGKLREKGFKVATAIIDYLDEVEYPDNG